MFHFISSANFKKFKFLERIVELMPAHVFWKDTQGVYLGCNESHAKNAGLTRASEIVGKTDFDLVWKAHAENFRQVDFQVIRENQIYTVEEPSILADGRSVVYLSQKMPLEDEDGKIIGVLGIAFDITAQKEAERQMQQAQLEATQTKAELKAREGQEYLESILALMPGHLYWKNKEGRFLGCNNLQAIDAGFSSPMELIGKTDYETPWKDQADALRKIDVDVMKTQTVHIVEETGTLANGKQAIFLSQKMPMLNAHKEVIGILGVSTDITAQKEAEHREKIALTAAVAEAQAKVEEESKFSLLAAQVAHDIRSPLAALEIITKQASEMPEKQRLVIRSSLNSIRDIANNLLGEYQVKVRGVRGMTQEDHRVVLVLPFIENILSEKKIQLEKQAIDLKLEVEESAAFSFVDIHTLDFKRLFSNLLNNSAEALSQGGNITICLSTQASQLVLKIVDNGSGIPPEILSHLFQAGASFGKTQGSGLGLIHAKHSIETWNGRLSLSSQVDLGTTVTILLPLAKAPAWSIDHLTLAKNTVVVILDDDQSIHAAWEAKFSSHALSLLHFQHTEPFLAWVRSASVEDLSNVFLLSDYELLGSSLNGLQAIEASKLRPAILVTSYFEDPKILQKCLELGVHLIPKNLVAYIPIQMTPN